MPFQYNYILREVHDPALAGEGSMEKPQPSRVCFNTPERNLLDRSIAKRKVDEKKYGRVVEGIADNSVLTQSASRHFNEGSAYF